MIQPPSKYSVRKDITGHISGKLTVIGIAPNKGRNTRWECRCECGKVSIVDTYCLTTKRTKSCGCMSSRKTVGVSQRMPEGVAASNDHYKQYRIRARNKKLAFSLDINEFNKIVRENCYYCNSEPVYNALSKRTYHDYYANGIDRIDSKQGYTPQNCRPCCWTCNQAKKTMSEEEFYIWISRLHNNLKRMGKV